MRNEDTSSGRLLIMLRKMTAWTRPRVSSRTLRCSCFVWFGQADVSVILHNRARVDVDDFVCARFNSIIIANQHAASGQRKRGQSKLCLCLKSGFSATGDIEPRSLIDDR